MGSQIQIQIQIRIQKLAPYVATCRIQYAHRVLFLCAHIFLTFEWGIQIRPAAARPTDVSPSPPPPAAAANIAQVLIDAIDVTP